MKRRARNRDLDPGLHSAGPPPAAVLGVLLVALLVAATIGWAAWARVEVVVQGNGRVIPSQQAQVVQSLEGGIVREILVAEGDIVDVAQIVARIDGTRFVSELGEQHVRRVALRQRINRLSAEARGAEFVELPSTDPLMAHLALEEMELFHARRTELTQAIDVIRAQITLREDELREVQAREARLVTVLGLIDQEQAILAPLVRSNVVPRLEAVRLQREAAALQGELEGTRASRQRAESAIGEARERVSERVTAFRSAAQRDLSEARAQLAGVEETLRAAEDRVERTEVRSPVRGVVNRLDVTTRGSVLQPGRTLMEITPLDDLLLVEVRIRPADIAELRPGMAASVRLTAHDYAKHRTLRGHVLRIGSNTIQDERGETFYRVVVQTTMPDSMIHGDLVVMPGMQGWVDLILGTRSVLEYLLKPVTRVLDNSLRER